MTENATPDADRCENCGRESEDMTRWGDGVLTCPACTEELRDAC